MFVCSGVRLASPQVGNEAHTHTHTSKGILTDTLTDFGGITSSLDSPLINSNHDINGVADDFKMGLKIIVYRKGFS